MAAQDEKGPPQSQESNEAWLKLAAKAPVHPFPAKEKALSPCEADTIAAQDQPNKETTPSTEEKERYQTEGEVARGGLGRILRAHDRRLDRPVALKELLRREGRLEERFLREALLTAKLEHPSIIPVHDLGLTKDGSPYYAMKLIDGRSFDKVIEEKKTLAERLSLLSHVLDASEALAYAHAKRIIHRDLKPQNILVGPFGETIVVDWGLAKELRDQQQGTTNQEETEEAKPYRAREESHLTQEGSILGTPAFMPPEQAKGESVDERADVYSLGAILYHLLAGEPPYKGKSSKEILAKLLREPPKLLQNREPRVPKDLLAIVQKAMAREPAERYESAKGLRDDLKKFQTGQLVEAYQYTRAERLRRWIFRNKVYVSAAGIVLAAVAVAFVVILQNQEHLSQELEKVEQNQAHLAAQLDEARLDKARLSLERAPWKSLQILAELSETFPRFSAARVIAADALSRGVPTLLQGHTSYVQEIAFSPDGKTLASAGGDQTVRLWSVARKEAIKTFSGHKRDVTSLAFSPDGARLASADSEGKIWLWELSSGEGKELTGHTSFIDNVLFSSDGARLFSASGDQTIRIWELSTGTVRVLYGHSSTNAKISLSPDGKSIAASSLDPQNNPSSSAGFSLRIWDVETGEASLFDTGLNGSLAVFSPDGAFLAASGSNETVLLWDLATKTKKILPAPGGFCKEIAFSPDGSLLAASSQKKLYLWDASSGEAKDVIVGVPSFGLSVLTFSRDGALLAFPGEGGTLQIWEKESNTIRSLPGHSGGVLSLRFSPDGETLASAGQDTVVALHDLSSQREKTLPGHSAQVSVATFSQSGSLLASGSFDKTVRLWDLKVNTSKVLEGHAFPVVRLSFSPDESLLASGDVGAAIFLWDLKSLERRILFGHTDYVSSLEFSPDGAFLASGSFDKTIQLFRVRDGKIQVLRGHEDRVLDVAFSPDGSILASASQDGTIRLWEVATGESRVLRGHTSWVNDISFSPNGAFLASAGSDQEIILWELSGQGKGPVTERQRFTGFEKAVLAIDFSPDGRTLVSGSAEGSIRLWDVETGQGRLLNAHEAGIVKIAFSPKGERVASTSQDGSVYLWDVSDWRAAPSVEHRALRGERKNPFIMEFSPDGERLVLGAKGLVYLFPDDLPLDPGSFYRWLQGASASSFRFLR